MNSDTVAYMYLWNGIHKIRRKSLNRWPLRTSLRIDLLDGFQFLFLFNVLKAKIIGEWARAPIKNSRISGTKSRKHLDTI